MKKAILILGIAAAAMAVSCNKDEVKNSEIKFFEGDKAYIVVNINGVSAAETRADDSFKMGSVDEYAVEDASFYFYDSEGEFVTEAMAWNETGTAYSDGSSIEYGANTVVTLSGLTQVTYPNWVVTVLNKPAGFTAPKSLEEFAAVLADAESELYQSGNTNFTMTTSAYQGTENVYDDAYYFATPVSSENFVPEEIEYDTDGVTPTIPTGYAAVTIYVERLAAKVTLTTSLSGTEIAGDTYYALNQSVISGEMAEDQTLYVKFNGWKLNATAKQSYYMKAIDPTAWDNIGFDWNDADNYRCYWAKAWPYGLSADTDFPDKSEGTVDGSTLSDYLTYTSLDGDLNEIGSNTAAGITYGGVEYCAENTNTAEIAAIPSAVTSILLSATVCDETGEGIDLIRHDGQIYTLDAYLAIVLEHVPEVYYTEDNSTYTLLDASFLTVDVDNSKDGYVSVILDPTYSSATFYVLDESGAPTETTYDADTITGYINNFNTNYGSDANYFNGGEMYYSIPIRHMNTLAEGSDDITEGYYGVVRNHWYLGTVSNISGLGKGIANSAEVIVPLPEDDTYYIGAQVNILEWKYVTWEIEL